MAEMQKDDSFKLIIETNSEQGAEKVKSFVEGYSKDSPDNVSSGEPSKGKKADFKMELTFKNEGEANTFLQKAKADQDAINQLEIQNAKGQKIASLSNGQLKDINGKDISEKTELSKLQTQPTSSPGPTPKKDEKKQDDKDNTDNKDKTLWDTAQKLHEKLWAGTGKEVANTIMEKIKDKINEIKTDSKPDAEKNTDPEKKSDFKLTSPNDSAEQPTTLASESTASDEKDFDVIIRATPGNSLDKNAFQADDLNSSLNADGTMSLSFDDEASATKFLVDAASKTSDGFTVEKEGDVLATAGGEKLTGTDGTQITADSSSLTPDSQDSQTILSRG